MLSEQSLQKLDGFLRNPPSQRGFTERLVDRKQLNARPSPSNNKERNLSINNIDNLMRPLYREGAPFHTETYGSLLNRITIQYLKYMHMRSAGFLQGDRIRSHLETLIQCSQNVYDRILEGSPPFDGPIAFNGGNPSEQTCAPKEFMSFGKAPRSVKWHGGSSKVP